MAPEPWTEPPLLGTDEPGQMVHHLPSKGGGGGVQKSPQLVSSEVFTINTPRGHSIQPMEGIFCLLKKSECQRTFRTNPKRNDAESFASVQSLAVCLLLISANRHQPPRKTDNSPWKLGGVQWRSATNCKCYGTSRKVGSLTDRRSPRRSFSGPHGQMPSLPWRAGPHGLLTTWVCCHCCHRMVMIPLETSIPLACLPQLTPHMSLIPPCWAL